MNQGHSRTAAAIHDQTQSQHCVRPDRQRDVPLDCCGMHADNDDALVVSGAAASRVAVSPK